MLRFVDWGVAQLHHSMLHLCISLLWIGRYGELGSVFEPQVSTKIYRLL